MIYSLRGTLEVSEPGFAVVECSGVGFRCQTTVNTQRTLKLNTEVMLYTHMVVREDAMELFGFATKTELQSFKLLLAVNGVGPRMALALLSELSPETLAVAIAGNDIKSLTRASGVGPKLAQRIVLELKDKLKGLAFSDMSVDFSGSVIQDTGNISKAVAALAVLGYSAADVTQILSGLDASQSVESLISQTLKRMGG